ncbi:conserved hypothetical protein [Candidatus Sulfobium mesophilum]|uniref:Putative nickel insertion protein n=1 Tax=Candidatus Sulfobium mesophilum TaxID=2016548 RepID=A0A2U3QDP2_9BACT|nr:conserved hypothetical protein [Candidatus Sulfobium mesophilum]
MMKIAYFDCFSGISGDMCLGALVDAGVPLEEISKGLRRLPLRGYQLSEKKTLRAGVSATKVDVVLRPTRPVEKTHGKKWADIEKVISSSSFTDDIRQKGLDIFRFLFSAESKVHGVSFNKVHLHELGAVDCLVDIFGTLIGLDLLGIKGVYASPVNLGSGFIKTAHGTMPVPAPATAEILKSVPVYSSGPLGELTTPTGAAILKHLSCSFGGIPVFKPRKIGLGAGTNDFEHSPNILRILIGDLQEKDACETVTVIETNIDDMNPQVYEYLAEKLFDSGALDVFLTQTIMKKMRPGVKLSVICDHAVRDDLIHLILRETTSIGIRYYEASRVTMKRSLHKVRLTNGKIGIKVSCLEEIEKFSPEYEDCKAVAKKSGRPLTQVIDEARKTAMREIAKKKKK